MTIELICKVGRMRVIFPQGVPKGCLAWLEANVGRGNVTSRGKPFYYGEDKAEYDWFYEAIQVHNPDRWTNTVTVKDPKLATLFALRWSP